MSTTNITEKEPVISSTVEAGLRLNLGCGNRKIEGYIGVDSVKTDITDVVWDLCKYPWPWKDSSVKEVLLVHVLEHMPDILGFMDELYRVMEPEGVVGIEGPYWTSVGCWQDPTHKIALSEELFHYFDKRFRKEQDMEHFPSKVDFQVIRVNYKLHDDYKKLLDSGKITQDDVKWAIRHHTNVVGSFAVVLRTIK